jgi:DNA-binding NarL/FixJ family response regulator
MLLLLRRKLPDTRIIVFSGSLDARSVKTSLDCNADGFVEKAYGLEELNRAIRKVLAGEKYFSAGAQDYVNKLRSR